MKATSYQPPKSAIFRSAFVALWWSCALHDAGLAQSPEQSVENRKSEEIAPASEILPAIPAVEATAYDEQIIENARAGTAAQRLQFLETYEELFNWQMTESLAELILEKEGSDSIPALKAVTEAYLRMKKGSQAVETSARLAKLDRSPDNHALLAEALAMVGRHSEAASALAAAKASQKESSMFKWQEELAFALFHAGETTKAKKAFQEIIDGEDYPAPLKTIADKQLRLMSALDAQHWMHEGENEKAVAILEKLKRSGGPHFEYEEDLGFAYQNLGRISDARKAFNAILQGAGYTSREKSNARDQINLLDSVEAEQLKDQGDYERALALLNRLKKQFRNGIFPFQDQLAYTLAESGDSASAREAFQEIADNQSYPEDQRRKAREEIQEMEIADLLTKGYAALEGRINWRQARQIDALLMNQYGSHPDAIGFHASILSLSGQCEQAIEILERLRDSRSGSKEFPQAGLLAECYYQMGRFEEAKLAYRQAFETSAIEPKEQIALRDSYQGFRRETRPTLDMSIATQNEGEGNTVTTEIEARVPFGAGWAIGADYKRFDTDGNDSQETLATVEKNWGSGYFAQIKAGTNEGDAAYAATIGKNKRALGSTAWSVGYHKNETADDTSELTSDGGRQERVSVELQHDITPNLRVSAGGNWRSVETDKMDIGSGYDVNFEAAYGWNMANSRKRSFEVAYVANASRFDDNQAAGGSETVVAAIDSNGELIDSDYHRQGAEMRWFGDYGKLEPYTMAGGYYRVDEGSFEFELGGGVDFDVNDDTTVYVRGQYSSSGEGQNTGKGVMEGQLGVEKTF